MAEESVNTETPEAGNGGQENYAPVTFGLSDLNSKFGREFTSLDDLYGFHQQEVSSGREKIDEAETIRKQWESMPDPVKYFTKLAAENPGMDHDQLLGLYTEQLSVARTDFSKLAATNPAEVLVRATVASNPAFTREEAERKVSKSQNAYRSTYSQDMFKASYSELGDEERALVDKEVLADMVADAKMHVPTLEKAKPSFSAPKPDPAAIQRQQEEVARFKSGLKSAASAPYEVSIGDSKVSLQSPGRFADIMAALEKAPDPGQAALEHLFSLMVDENNVFSAQKTAALFRKIEASEAAYKEFYDKALSEAVRKKEASQANAGGGGGNAANGVQPTSISDIYRPNR